MTTKEEIDQLTPAQREFVLGWIVNAIVTRGQARLSDMLLAINEARRSA